MHNGSLEYDVNVAHQHDYVHLRAQRGAVHTERSMKWVCKIYNEHFQVYADIDVSG
jgi:hypothetical protein